MVGQQWINELDDAVDQFGPPLRRWRQVGHTLDHRFIGLLAIGQVGQRLGHRDYGLAAVGSYGEDVPTKLLSVDAMQAAGDPEIGEIAIPSAGLAPLHRGDYLLRQIERKGI